MMTPESRRLLSQMGLIQGWILDNDPGDDLIICHFGMGNPTIQIRAEFAEKLDLVSDENTRIPHTHTQHNTAHHEGIVFNWITPNKYWKGLE